MGIPEAAERIPVIPVRTAEMEPIAEEVVPPERGPIPPVEAAEIIAVPVRPEAVGTIAAQDHPAVAVEPIGAPVGLHDPPAVIAAAVEAAAPQEVATAAVAEVAVPQEACEAAAAVAVRQEAEAVEVAVAVVAVAEVKRNQ